MFFRPYFQKQKLASLDVKREGYEEQQVNIEAKTNENDQGIKSLEKK